jgi:hypothetical protein
MSVLAIDWGLVTALIASGISVYALFQTHRHKVMELRPWFAIDAMELVKIGDKQHLRIRLRHVSGGVALSVRCALAIGATKSSDTVDTPALLPGDTVTLVSHVITGPPISDNQPVAWFFTFEDEFSNQYEIRQTNDLRGKQISYTPRKL